MLATPAFHPRFTPQHALARGCSGVRRRAVRLAINKHIRGEMGGDQRVWWPRLSRRPLSDSSNSPAASSQKSSKSAMSVAQMTGSPSKLAISNENLTKPATNSQLNTVAEQVNILLGCSETHTRKLDSLVKILKAVAEKNGVSADILDDGPDDVPEVEYLAGSSESA